MTDPKDTKLTLMISEGDMAMLKALAEADDVSASHVVRQAIRRVYTERFGGGGEGKRIFQGLLKKELEKIRAAKKTKR